MSNTTETSRPTAPLTGVPQPHSPEELWRLLQNPQSSAHGALHLGEALVQSGVITARQLVDALQTQVEERKLGVYRQLGRQLLDKGVLSEAQLRQAIATIPTFQENGKFSQARYAEFIKSWNKPTPPTHLQYFGCWGDDVAKLYMGSPDKFRDANAPRPNYMPHPKDVRIAELELMGELPRDESGRLGAFQRGVSSYLLDVTGEIRAVGHKPDGSPWRIAIEAPRDDQQVAQKVLSLDGLGVSTSGDYRNFFMHQGRRYSHEIDPASAAPMPAEAPVIRTVRRRFRPRPGRTNAA